MEDEGPEGLKKAEMYYRKAMQEGIAQFHTCINDIHNHYVLLFNDIEGFSPLLTLYKHINFRRIPKILKLCRFTKR